MSVQEETVGEAGEASVLAAVLSHFRPAAAARVGPGDDCAVLELQNDIVVTTDTMVQGPDFRLEWHSGFELGQKLAATNLSDVAAMGAVPRALTVAFSCPAETPLALLSDIARGIDSALELLAPGCGVVGGDLGRAPVLMAAVTAMGELGGRAPVTRAGARPGDTVAYAGELGLSGQGLSLLFAHGRSADGVRRVRERHPAALRAHLTPAAPISAGRAAALGGASAMMDVSDGLSLDAARLARASGATLALDSGRLVSEYGVQHGERVSLDSMLTGGEDHGLLATFPPGCALPESFVTIGCVTEAQPGVPVLLDGAPYEPRGWDPYRPH